MEIERKFLIPLLPNKVYDFPSDTIIQGYISRDPVIRIRKRNNDYFVTYKSKGLMVRQEFEDEITQDQFSHLKNKVDDHLIYKVRYKVPLNNHLLAEVDIFDDQLKGLIMVEVEFESEEEAESFSKPDWFGDEVTFDSRYQNSHLCLLDSISEL